MPSAWLKMFVLGGVDTFHIDQLEEKPRLVMASLDMWWRVGFRFMDCFEPYPNCALSGLTGTLAGRRVKKMSFRLAASSRGLPGSGSSSSKACFTYHGTLGIVSNVSAVHNQIERGFYVALLRFILRIFRGESCRSNFRRLRQENGAQEVSEFFGRQNIRALWWRKTSSAVHPIGDQVCITFVILTKSQITALIVPHKRFQAVLKSPAIQEIDEQNAKHRAL